MAQTGILPQLMGQHLEFQIYEVEGLHYMSLVVREPEFCICENKDADQLRGNCEANRCLCFRFTDSTIPLLPGYEILSL